MLDNVRSIETNQLIKNIISRGYWILTNDDDGDKEMCTTFKETTNIMDNLDELYITIIQKTTNKELGWFRISFWNTGDEQIVDCTANALCENIINEVTKRGEELRKEIINKYGNL